MRKSVYFLRPIGMAGPVKIGCSEYPALRAKTMTTWSPWPLEVAANVPGDHALEHRLHAHFSYCHSHGEWFFASAELIGLIEELRHGSRIEDAVDLTVVGLSPLKGKKKNIAPETRERMRYYQRMNGRLRSASKHFGVHVTMPSAIGEIMRRWSGHWADQAGTGIRPTAEEFAMLEAFIIGLPGTAVPSDFDGMAVDLIAMRAKVAA